MGRKIAKGAFSADAWRLAERQHGAVSREQLLKLGLTPEAVAHRLLTGRLHRVAHGVYAVGRPDLSREGQWSAALLGCGSTAVLSHRSAAALWGFHPDRPTATDVTVAPRVRRTRPGVVIHRGSIVPEERLTRADIPVTSVPRTLLDLATQIGERPLERAINEADKLDLIDPETLRAVIDGYDGRPGVVVLRRVLDRHGFRLTDSALEREFLTLVRRSGLPMPDTGTRLNGFKVDFHWPSLGLIVETDGLRYHRTIDQQMRDCLRDQAQTAAGLTTLRFTHFQVHYEPRRVENTLIAVATRLRGGSLG